MVEVMEYLEKDEDKEELKGFIKKFVKMKPKNARDLRNKLESLELIKLRSEHIVKIIDMMPETHDELNKIFVDVSLNEDESKKLLDTIKEFK